MRPVTAQVSLYPLRRRSLGPTIDRALGLLRERGLEIEPGRMSTLVSGPVEELFSALEQVFQEAAQAGEVVLVVTVSNACPREGPS